MATVHSDGSACRMASGTANRAPIAGVTELAALIGQLASDQAIVLGALRYGLPDEVEVTTKAKRKDGVYTSSPAPRMMSSIARDSRRSRCSTPTPRACRIRSRPRSNGRWRLAGAASGVAGMDDVARVERRSTSSGLSRSDTEEELPGSEQLCTSILRSRMAPTLSAFYGAFHERCWLSGLGWMMISKSGALLERSPIDRMVFGPERLVFEGAPILIKPIVQDQKAGGLSPRRNASDTSAVFPPLTIVETAKFEELRAKEEQRLAPGVAKVRSAYVEDKAKEMVARKPDVTLAAARQVIEHQCEGTLLPDVVLPFDDDELAGCTVGDVLADPDRFVGAILADPDEGVEYGRCKAMILRRSDGTVFINSFAHGGIIYHLKLDAAAVRTAIEAAAARKRRSRRFVELAVPAELEALRRKRAAPPGR